jgi:hypothetical protein
MTTARWLILALLLASMGCAHTSPRDAKPEVEMPRARGTPEASQSHGAEFDRQVDRLVEKGYPKAMGMAPAAFRAWLSRLRPLAAALPAQEAEVVRGRLPFVLVIKSSSVSAEVAMPLVSREGETGHEAMTPVHPQDFHPIDRVQLPAGEAYLIVDVERGEATLNVRPEDALKQILAAQRSPLTIDEGVSIVVQYPEFLQRNHCLSLPGSRRGDQRVPALWLDGDNRPKLGWCWDRNPHTWLGSASCARRLGMPPVTVP